MTAHQGRGSRGEAAARARVVEPTYPIASVDRVLRLLLAVSEYGCLSVTEAAQLLGSSASTAHRMLQMLVSYELVEQDQHRVYVRGRGLNRLASEQEKDASGAMMVQVAAPYLARARDHLHTTIHLLTLEGNGVRFLASAERLDPTGLASSRVGWLLPAHTSAGGKILLAYLPDMALSALYPDGVPLTRSGRVQTLSQLRRELRQARSWQWARSLREVHSEISAIAVPVDEGLVGPRYAFSAGWRAADYPIDTEEAAVDVLRECAADLADHLQRLRGTVSSPGRVGSPSFRVLEKWVK